MKIKNLAPNGCSRNIAPFRGPTRAVRPVFTEDKTFVDADERISEQFAELRQDTDTVIDGPHRLPGLPRGAKALGGTLTIENTPGAGTTIVVEVASDDPHSDR